MSDKDLRRKPHILPTAPGLTCHVHEMSGALDVIIFNKKRIIVAWASITWPIVRAALKRKDK